MSSENTQNDGFGYEEDAAASLAAIADILADLTTHVAALVKVNSYREDGPDLKWAYGNATQTRANGQLTLVSPSELTEVDLLSRAQEAAKIVATRKVEMAISRFEADARTMFGIEVAPEVDGSDLVYYMGEGLRIRRQITVVDNNTFSLERKWVRKDYRGDISEGWGYYAYITDLEDLAENVARVASNTPETDSDSIAEYDSIPF